MRNDDELRRLVGEVADYNDSFRGDEINEDKLEKLNRMKKICGEICELDPRIDAPFMPFDKTCRNGTAQIMLPYLLFTTDDKVRSRISSLVVAADDLAFSALDGEHIRITFGLHDMWTAFHYEGYEGNE